MTSKSRDTSQRAHVLRDAYAESLVGLFALRLEPVKAAIRVHAPQMALLSSYEDQALLLQAKTIVDSIPTGFSPELQTAIDILTGSFIAAMWDLLQSHAHYDKISTAPDIQFFRHLRNACGHDGKWNFSKLQHPAEWRHRKLTMGDIGNAAFDSTFRHADVVLLFEDIDHKYFERLEGKTATTGFSSIARK